MNLNDDTAIYIIFSSSEVLVPEKYFHPFFYSEHLVGNEDLQKTTQNVQKFPHISSETWSHFIKRWRKHLCLKKMDFIAIVSEIHSKRQEKVLLLLTLPAFSHFYMLYIFYQQHSQTSMRKKSSHYHWEYYHETEKLTENTRHLLEAESSVEVGYVLMQMFKLQLDTFWHEKDSYKSRGERRYHWNTCICKRRKANDRRVYEKEQEQRNNWDRMKTGTWKEKAVRFFPDCTWSHYRNNILSPLFPQK